MWIKRGNQIQQIDADVFAKSSLALKGWAACDAPAPRPGPTPEQLFDPRQARAALFVAFHTKLDVFAPIWSVISDLLNDKDFNGLKIFMTALLSKGTIAQSDVDSFKAVLAAQNISL